jgi:exosortase
VCLPGFSLLVLGPRRTRAIAFPLALGFLMLPIPSGFRSGIHLALREMTTSGSAWLLHQLGRPALANGTLLHMPHGSFHVVEECSGFSAVYAAITVALVLAYLSRSWGRRVLLLALAFPLALGGNVLRITGLGLLAESRGYEILETPVHVLSGYASFVLSLALLFLFAERRSRSRAA